MSEETTESKTGAATYSPEDNKLRLYIGRVPRDEYLKLKAEGWTALYKQREAGQGDFAATEYRALAKSLGMSSLELNAKCQELRQSKRNEKGQP